VRRGAIFLGADPFMAVTLKGVAEGKALGFFDEMPS
jgi:hypothetical protein